jgi:exopolyphosphatase/pppGpp-phosphohydrolase
MAQRISEEIGGGSSFTGRKCWALSPLWTVWRSGLPRAEQMDETVRARLRLWASFQDPDFAHSEFVTRLALQIYDGLDSLSLLETMSLPNARFLLEAAALAHGVGRYTAQKKYWIRSYRMLRKLSPSPGLDAESLNILAIVARYHRGALPNARHKALSPVPP